MGQEGRSTFSKLLRSWGLVGAGIFILLCLWRLPYAADLRPEIQFGMTGLDLAKAWLPEGILLGIGAFVAHRVGGDGGAASSGGFSGFLIYFCLWLIIWGLAVLLPGWLLFCYLAEMLKPARDVFLLGGLPGAIFAGGMVLVYGMVFIGASLTASIIAAVIGAFAMPKMIGLSLGGSTGLAAKRPDAGKALLILCLIGGLYWLWRGWWFFYGPADVWFRVIPDTAGIVLLLGWCAILLERQRKARA